ncbi:hypothetical protein NS183_14025 [Microbacterium testaceum]|uniref:hypothetical protein n=1 Tax=Microbacterium testaceum TaxID=2033 RepID=UPI000734BE46|nr:hypothetical protein [Microbacterium testaceum]KTS84498.1 hypothetical protein NS183_14025 [Microbacterium testaceum]
MSAPPLARLARDQYLSGDEPAATRSLTELIRDISDREVAGVAINRDVYSLNSLNGTVDLDGERFFFKFHAEEGEDDTIQEYYNAELLQAAGYPVDVPALANGEPGRQILLYRLRRDPRFSDLCRGLEVDGAAADTPEVREAVQAQRDLDAVSSARMRETLHSATAAELAAEPVNRLFRDRLFDPADDPAGTAVAGRVARFYRGKEHRLGGARTVILDDAEFFAARWVVNGVEYDRTVGELFDEALVALVPERYGPAAVIAHGDAHNANVWFERADDGRALLTQFDPAFAGRHVPALLAEVKTTFHNVFAHPFWLYEPAIATERYSASVSYADGRLVVDHDHDLGVLRGAFLDTKAELIWRPLLADLHERGWLPADWRRLVRLALMCCPTLVHELRAGGPTGHTPVSAAIGWSIAVAAGAEPVAGDDVFTEFFAAVSPE